jgi:hypothetical protein
MLELMNCVLVDRTHKETQGKRKSLLRKRDQKNRNKDCGGGVPTSSDDPSDIRPIVQQIFNPTPSSFKGETSVVAVDCEMVETDRFGEGLARVSIVNYNGNILLDKFVIPEG